MNYYVTFFDKNYLPHGMALYESMCKFCNPFKLIILCVDDKTFEIINLLKLENVQLLKLSNLENEELKKAKKTRTQTEYCWTLTPFSVRFAFESNPLVDQITYIDADMWFMKSPQPIFYELKESKKEILITRHGFSKEYDQTNDSGEFCVQFITFSRKAEDIRVEWEQNCLKWCFNRIEEEKFGDQKYLEEWPKKYSSRVHISKNDEWFLAPWNATRFNYENGIVWHFHAAKILSNRNFELLGLKCLEYEIPLSTQNFVYKNYFASLKNSVYMLKKLNFNISNNYKFNIRTIMRELLKKLVNKNFNFLVK